MPVVGPGQVVDHPIGCPHFYVGGVVVERYKAIRDHGEWKRARLWIVKRRPVDINLGLVQNVWCKRVLQRKHVVCRVVYGLKLIRWEAAAIRRVHQAYVALGTAIE